jgi:hypothetical protein
MSFVEKSICVLSEEEYDLIKSAFIDKTKVTKLAKTHFCTRGTIYYRLENILKKIVEVYDEGQNA